MCLEASEGTATLGGLELAHLPCLLQPHAGSVCGTIPSLGSGRVSGLSLAELLSWLHKRSYFLLVVTREGEGERALGPDKASFCNRTWHWPPAAFIIPIVTGSRAGFLSALFREALLIHPRENGSFIGIDIINEEAGSMLYQLTPQGKVKWAFFWRVVPKLRTVTHSK